MNGARVAATSQMGPLVDSLIRARRRHGRQLWWLALAGVENGHLERVQLTAEPVQVVGQAEGAGGGPAWVHPDGVGGVGPVVEDVHPTSTDS